MADLSQNLMTNKVLEDVNDQDDKVIRFVNPFKNYHHQQKDDFSLFLNNFKKCRFCFSKFVNASDQHIMDSQQRQAFLALTDIKLSISDSENFLCLICVEMLKIINDLREIATNLQKCYFNFLEDLVSDIKTEKEEEIDEISGRLMDGSEIVISDDESSSDEIKRTAPQKQTDSSGPLVNIITHNGDMTETEEQIAESSAGMKKCSVRLTKLDPDTVDQFEYNFDVGSTEQQLISQSSSTIAKLVEKSIIHNETIGSISIDSQVCKFINQ